MRTERVKARGRMYDHPLYTRWNKAKGQGTGLCAEWQDFWSFVEGVGDSGGCTKLHRLDKTLPLGPGNFRWAQKLVGEHRRAYLRERYKSHPAARELRYRKQYGIGVAEYEEILAAQGGGCAICRAAESKVVRHGVNHDTRRLAVDHDHDTGEIRGLLCVDCNRALGIFKDDPAILMAAMSYLIDFKRTRFKVIK